MGGLHGKAGSHIFQEWSGSREPSGTADRRGPAQQVCHRRRPGRERRRTVPWRCRRGVVLRLRRRKHRRRCSVPWLDMPTRVRYAGYQILSNECKKMHSIKKKKKTRKKKKKKKKKKK